VTKLQPMPMPGLQRDRPRKERVGAHTVRTLSPDPGEVAVPAAKKKLRWSGMPAPGTPHDYDDMLPSRAPGGGDMSRARSESPKPDSDQEA
jgi:hypothetical protein